MSLMRISLVLLIIGTQTGIIFSQKMPDDANKLYQNFTDAIVNSDLAGLEASLCKASFVNMKNEALSFGMKYPDEVFEGTKMALLDFKNFKYISFKKNGPTVNAYYTYSENKVEQVIVTICMVEEEGKLKIIQLKTRDAKDFVTNLNKKDYSFLDLVEFQPLGIIPVVPIAIEKVDFIANVDITCYGYIVSVAVNGIFQEEVKNKSRSGVVIGGVKKGENTIEFSIERTDPNEQEKPAIGIRALINGVEQQVFYFNEDLVGKSIQRTFVVK